MPYFRLTILSIKPKNKKICNDSISLFGNFGLHISRNIYFYCIKRQVSFVKFALDDYQIVSHAVKI